MRIASAVALGTNSLMYILFIARLECWLKLWRRYSGTQMKHSKEVRSVPKTELSLTSRLWRYKTPQKVYTLCRLIPISPHTRRVSVVPSKCLSDAVYGQKTSAFGAWFSPNFRPYPPWVIFYFFYLILFSLRSIVPRWMHNSTWEPPIFPCNWLKFEERLNY